MRTKLATYALVGTLGLTGIAGAALIAPAVSYAAAGDGMSGDSTDLTDRVSRIGSALAGLVTDGTLTQAQADRVATTLAEALPRGHRGHGGRIAQAAVADALGITPEQLRAESRAGKTLAEIAAEQGVEDDTLVAALVASAQERLDAAVADGRLTQAEADERTATLTERVTDQLDEVLSPRAHGGRGGHGPGRSMQAPDVETTPEITPSVAT